MEASAKTAHTKGPGLIASLTGAGLPGLAGLALSGGNPVGFAAGVAGAKAAQAGYQKFSHLAARHLARLVRAAHAGSATAEQAIAAIKGGVPAAVVNTVMSGVGQPLALAGAAYGAEGVGQAFDSLGRHGGGGEEADAGE